MKAEPTVPDAVRALVIAGAGGVTVITSIAIPEPSILRARIVTLVVPAAVGVPDITPVEAFNVKPAGNVLIPYIVGVFDAVIVYVKAEPTVPDAVSALVITGEVAVTLFTDEMSNITKAI